MNSFSKMHWTSQIIDRINGHSINEYDEIQNVRELQNEADHLFSCGNFAEAASMYSEALEIDPNSTQLLILRAVAYLENDNFAEARTDAQSLLTSQSQIVLSQANYILGVINSKEGNSIEALEYFLKVLLLDPSMMSSIVNDIITVCGDIVAIPESLVTNCEDNVEKMVILAEYLLKKNALTACEMIVQSSLQLECKMSDFLFLRCLLTAARILAALNKVESARILYQECISKSHCLDSIDFEVEATVELSFILLENGLWIESIIFNERLLGLLEILFSNPDSVTHWTSDWLFHCKVEVLLNLSTAYRELDDLSEATKYKNATFTIVENHLSSIGITSIKHFDQSDAITKEPALCNLIASLYKTCALLSKSKDDIPSALSEASHHISLVFSSKDDLEKQAAAYYLMGAIYRLSKDINNAEDHLQTSLSLYKKLNDYVKIVCCRLELAQCLIDRNHSSVVNDLLEIIKLAKRLPSRDLECNALIVLAKLFFEQKELAKAIHTLDSALRITTVNPSTIYSVESLLGVFLQNSHSVSELEKAELILSEIIDWFELLTFESNLKKIDHLKSVSEALVSVLSRLGKFEKALSVSERLSMTSFLYWNYIKSFKNRIPIKTEHRLYIRFHVAEDWMAIWSSFQGKTNFHWICCPDTSNICPGQLCRDVQELLCGHFSNCYKFESRSILLKSSNIKEHKGKVNSYPHGVLCTFEEMFFGTIHEVLSFLVNEESILISCNDEVFHLPFAALLHSYCLKNYGLSFNVRFIESIHYFGSYRLSAPFEYTPPQMQNSAGGQATRLSSLLSGPDIHKSSFREVPTLQFRRQLASPEDIHSDFSVKERESSEPLKSLAGSDFVSNGECPSKVASGINKSQKPKCDSISKRRDKHTSMTGNRDSKKTDNSFSTLVSSKWKGGEIETSPNAAKNYSQTLVGDIAVFMGAPLLPPRISYQDSLYKPVHVLKDAQHELTFLSNEFNTKPLIGRAFTRRNIAKVLEKCTVIHFAGLADLEHCNITYTPEGVIVNADPMHEDACIFSLTDILGISLSAKLVVLSVSSSRGFNSLRLASLFIAKGASCVVMPQAPLESSILLDFWRYFYRAFRKFEKCYVSRAMEYASNHLPEKIRSLIYMVQIGSDIVINMKDVKHNLLDDLINNIQDLSSNKAPTNSLNLTHEVKDRYSSLKRLRFLFSEFFIHNLKNFDVINQACTLINHVSDDVKKLSPSDLEFIDELVKNNSSLALLHHLGFDFQPKGKRLQSPLVIPPSRDPFELLPLAKLIVTSCSQLKQHPHIVESLAIVITLSDDVLNALLNILILTLNSIDVRLHVSDVAVEKTWISCEPRRFLKCLGFYQLGSLLLPYRSILYREIRTFVLHTLIGALGLSIESVNNAGIQILSRELSTNLQDSDDMEIPNFRMLSAVNNEKALIQTLDEVQRWFVNERKKIINHVKSFLKENASHTLNETFGRKVEKPDHVKVESGGKPGCERRPINSEPEWSAESVTAFRDHSHYILKWRLNDLEMERKRAIFRAISSSDI